MDRRTFIQLLGAAAVQQWQPKIATPIPPASVSSHPIGRFFCIDMAGTRVHPELARQLAIIQPGGFSIFGGNSKAAPRVVARFIADLRLAHTQNNPAPLLVMVDQESSKVARLRFRLTEPPNFTSLGRELQRLLTITDPKIFPTTRAALQTMLEDQLAQVRKQPALQAFAEKVQTWGQTVGQEMADLGIDALYAPVLDRSGSALLEQRAISPHPVVVTLVAQWYLQGLQKSGMKAIAKHAPGLGGAPAGIADPHLTQLLVQVNDVELFPFWALHQARLLAGLMVTHVTPSSIVLSEIAAADAQAVLQAQRPASISAPFIDLLRRYLQFDLPLLTDGLGMQGLQTFVGGDTAKGILLALLAGLDLAVTDPPTLDWVQLAAFQACATALPNLVVPNRPATQPPDTADREALFQLILNTPKISDLATLLNAGQRAMLANQLAAARIRSNSLVRATA